MLSIGRIGAGAGYRYLTGQVASGDVPRSGESLLDYYERSGYPAGEWVGSGAANLGLAGRVEESDMEALFGRGVDPRDGSQLGRRLPTYRSVEERVAERLGALGHEASEAERARLVAEELAKGTPQAVTGFDLTFSAPKSVSVLFALGDRETREAVRAAHEAAWREAFAHFEREVAATRLGAGGVAQVEVRGVTGAAFEHFASRAGDPQLHTHVATSVMVQTRDGRWRRLDSRALYRASATLREVYTGRLFATLAEGRGLGMTHRRSGRSERLVPEVEGVPQELIWAFSGRAVAIRSALERLVSDYHARHGYAPDAATTTRLAQQATLATREPPRSRTLAEATAEWRARAATVLSCSPEAVPALVAALVSERREAVPALTDEARVGLADRVLARLEEAGATWNAWDTQREAAAVLREAGQPSVAEEAARLAALTLALPEVRALTPAPEDPGALLSRGDGASVFTRRGEARYSSVRVLEAEARLVALARERRVDPAERARRAESLFSSLEDDALARLEAESEAALVAIGAELDALRPRDVELEARVAALASARRDLDAAIEVARAGTRPDPAVVERVQEITVVLSRTGLRAVRGEARARLVAERQALLDANPLLGPSAQVRERTRAAARRRAAELEAERGSLDAAEAALVAERRALAAEQALLEARRRERSELVAAVRAERTARGALPGSLDVAPHLGGLGVDQAAAVLRLADPTRGLDALIGPAGSGKTRALAALVAAHRGAGRGVHLAAPTAVAAKGLAEAVGAANHATLHGLLASWREGRDLPVPGDLVLVDEASMATTPALVEVASVAIANGASCRLVGDPRQLKAVGAGGGLALVAAATNAVELSELHRFDHAWEGEASLGLRRGDPAAVATYDRHGRLVATSEADALQQVFAAWWASPAGRDETVMIASDNESVAALSTLARDALVRAGEVAPEGVALADGGVAGVGDLVTTRRNARLLATHPNPGPGGYVRNHDRWRVEAVGADGSLRAAHLQRADRVVLPADYVGAHVALAYAETGHAVQGRTVARAEVLIRPGDTRTYAYVAMSRAKSESVAHVVVETGEPGEAVRSPAEVLAGVLRSEEPISASEWATAARAAEEDPAVLLARYRTAAAEELRHRLAQAMAAAGLEVDLGGELGWQLVGVAAELEGRGVDAARVVAGAAGLDGEALLSLLRKRLWRGASRPTELVGGLYDAPRPWVDPAVAAYEASLATRIHAWQRARYERLVAGEVDPNLADLGTPPEHGPARARWAAEAAVVALWRAASVGEASGSRVAAERARRAAERARGLATGSAPRSAGASEVDRPRRGPAGGPTAGPTGGPTSGPRR
jgi:conjugative relaxase-like TrwC/TraI family protein